MSYPPLYVIGERISINQKIVNICFAAISFILVKWGLAPFSARHLISAALTKDKDRDRIFPAHKELGYFRIIILDLLNRWIFREDIINVYDKAGPC
jgi:hypothetical protein